ncbi:FtsX-like permease family protein [Streptomyces fractus]|uniref:FtsX-like permease family protein n=1 Tax=Streptomyces fractus TaxID=641806 RepID=UPI003CEE2098
MTAVLLWVRIELRRRARSLTVLALLVALASGTVMASVAGAIRGSTSLDRLLENSRPVDAVALPNDPKFDWEPIRRLPEVAALATLAVSGFQVDGISMDAVGFPPADGEMLRTVERPAVLKGRLYNPHRVDEVVVSPGFPKRYGKGVGDHLTLHLATPRQMDRIQIEGTDTNASAGRLRGPVIRATIVGVVRSYFLAERPGQVPSVLATPEVMRRYPKNILGAKHTTYVNALVRLKNGAADVPRFRKDLARVTGRDDIDVWNMAERVSHDRHVVRFESVSLLAFGLAALVAAVFLVGQLLARYASVVADELRVLRAMGMTPRQAGAAAGATPGLAALAGALLGAVAAVVASRWMPIAAGARFEPAPGLDVDWRVLAPGVVLVAAAAWAGTSAAAWLALAADRVAPSPRRSAVGLAAGRAGLPVPVVVGVRFALEPGRGRSAVPVRPALVGAVVGTLGVLAAFTFSAGVNDAARHPERFGLTFQLAIYAGFDDHEIAGKPERTRAAAKAVAGDPKVASVTDTFDSVAVVNGEPVATWSYGPVGAGRLPTVLTEGRMPSNGREVVLAPSSAERAGAGVGDGVDVVGRDENHKGTFKVTGIGFLPEGPHNTYHEGAWITPGANRQLFGSQFAFHALMVQLHHTRPALDRASERALNKEGARLAGVGSKAMHAPAAMGVTLLEPPQQAAEVREVRALPVVLGLFLLVLAMGAVGHELATAVRRRGHDVAVLRALGMTRVQCRLLVFTQATTLALIGLAFGVPLGVATGRTLWRAVAASTPLDYRPPLALWALLLAGPLAVAAANLLATRPGRSAARLKVGQVLRAE